MYDGRTQEISLLPANGPGTQLMETCVLGVEILSHDGKHLQGSLSPIMRA